MVYTMGTYDLIHGTYKDHRPLLDKPELSGYGVGCFTKKRVFFCFFLPFLAVFGRGLVFFGVFFVFSWWYQVQTHLVVPRNHCFLNIFGIPRFSDVFRQRVFLFFSLMYDVPSSSTMGNTHVQLCMQIYDEMANRGAMGATHI